MYKEGKTNNHRIIQQEHFRKNINRTVKCIMQKNARDELKLHKHTYINNSIYAKNLNRKIKNFALFVSKNGTDLAGNIFRIIEELATGKYGRLKIYLAYTDDARPRIETMLSNYDLRQSVRLVEYGSTYFFYLLARAKYFTTDCFIPFEYIKRKDQVLVSTSHGTPIKVMGRDCKSETQGLIQCTHTLADYQTYSSDYMFDKLFSAFMEKDLFRGHALKSGYARNTIFFDRERGKALKNKLGYGGMTVYAYLPTFRGSSAIFESKEQANNIVQFCDELDKKLDHSYLVLIKLHNFNTETIDYSKYKHIQAFPLEYETYDVLNAVDGMITDYSSVLFDFAVCRKKIILFQYDFQEYMDKRGTYLSWDQLPYPVVSNVNDLYQEITMPKDYDDQEFYDTYCKYETPEATKNICKTVFLNQPMCEEFEICHNSKKNIFIYAGKCQPNTPETLRFIDYMNVLDTQKFNFFLFFYEYDLISKQCILNDLPADIQYYSHICKPVWTLKERKRFLRAKNDVGRVKALHTLYRAEALRWFNDLPIDVYIDLCGKDIHALRVAAEMHNSVKKVVLYDESMKGMQEIYEKYDVVLKYGKYGDVGSSRIIALNNELTKIDICTNCRILEQICKD